MAHPTGRVAVIVNPRSANGRTGKRWSELEREFRSIMPDFSLYMTDRPWHAAELARQALKNGHDRIVSVGGDGTHHEVLNGFFDGYLPVNPAASLAIYPHGTGSDLARTLGVLQHADAMAVLRNGRVIKVDIGRVTYSLASGGTDVRYFINVADFGIGGAVAERVQGQSKRLGPFLTFLLAVIRTLFTFKNPTVRLQIDGEVFETKTIDVIVANGQYFGGGIHVAKDARMDSGVFEVYVLGDIRLLTALRNLHHLYSGAYVNMPHLVRRFEAVRVVAQSKERVLLDLDGEQPGQLPAAIEMLPSALQLVVQDKSTRPSLL
ncbi:MAG: hypothetical protein AMXMBFR4_21950 [Candidatus Hydrogenedentota bacterium]